MKKEFFLNNKFNKYPSTNANRISYCIKKVIDLVDVTESLQKDKAIYEEKIKTLINDFHGHFLIDNKLKIGRIDIAQRRFDSNEEEYVFEPSKTTIFMVVSYDIQNLEEDLASVSTKQSLINQFKKYFNDEVSVEYSTINKSENYFHLTINTKRLFSIDKPIKYMFYKKAELDDTTFFNFRYLKLKDRTSINTLADYKVSNEIIWQCQKYDKLEGNYLYVDADDFPLYSLADYYNLEIKYNSTPYYNEVKKKKETYFETFKEREDKIFSKIKNVLLSTTLEEDFFDEIYYKVYLGKTKEIYLNISIPSNLFNEFEKLDEQFINPSFSNYIKFKNINDFRIKLNTFKSNNQFYKSKIEKDKNKIVNLNLSSIEAKLENVFQTINAKVNFDGNKDKQIVLFSDNYKCSPDEIYCSEGETNCFIKKCLIDNVETNINFSYVNDDISAYCLMQLSFIQAVSISRLSYKDYYKNYIYSKVLFESTTEFVKKTFLNQNEKQNSSAFSYEFNSRIIVGTAVSSQIASIKDNLNRERELFDKPSNYLSQSPKQTIAEKLATLNSLEGLYNDVVARFYLQDIVDEAKKCISAKTKISETTLNKITVATLIQSANEVFDNIDNMIVFSKLIPDELKNEMIIAFFQCMPFVDKPLEQLTSTALKDSWTEYKKRALTILGDDSYTPEEKEQAKLKIFDCASTVIKQYKVTPAIQDAQNYIIKNAPILQPLANELGPISSNLYDAVSGDLRESLRNNPDSSYRNNSGLPTSNSTNTLFIDSAIALSTFLLLGGLKKFILTLLKGAKCKNGKATKTKIQPPSLDLENDLIILLQKYFEEIFSTFDSDVLCDIFFGDNTDNLFSVWLVLSKPEYTPLKTSDLSYKGRKILIGGLATPDILKSFMLNSNALLELGMKEKCSAEDPLNPDDENCLDTSEEYWENRKTELLLSGYKQDEVQALIKAEQKELEQALNDINTFKFEFPEQENISPEISKFLRDSLLTQEQNYLNYVKNLFKEIQNAYKPINDMNYLTYASFVGYEPNNNFFKQEEVQKFLIMYPYSNIPSYSKEPVEQKQSKISQIINQSYSEITKQIAPLQISQESINNMIFDMLYKFYIEQVATYLIKDTSLWFEANKEKLNNFYITQVCLTILSKTSIKDLKFESYDNIKELKELLGIKDV
jgi:hypothetical protein